MKNSNKSLNGSNILMNPEYEKIASLMAANNLFVIAAELHGLISGQVSSGSLSPLPELSWQLLELESECPSIIKQLIERLGATVLQQMEADEFTFHPLLPEDDEELSLRLYALGKWCEGFNIGFGAGFGKSDSAMLEETREVINDFTQIAEIEDKQEEVTEENEKELMELIEYVRMAVVTVFDQNAHQKKTAVNSH